MLSRIVIMYINQLRNNLSQFVFFYDKTCSSWVNKENVLSFATVSVYVLTCIFLNQTNLYLNDPQGENV